MVEVISKWERQRPDDGLGGTTTTEELVLLRPDLGGPILMLKAVEILRVKRKPQHSSQSPGNVKRATFGLTLDVAHALYNRLGEALSGRMPLSNLSLENPKKVPVEFLFDKIRKFQIAEAEARAEPTKGKSVMDKARKEFADFCRQHNLPVDFSPPAGFTEPPT